MRHHSTLVRWLVVALLLATATAPALGAETTDSDCDFPVERTDATGETVRLEQEPERVVTLNPSAAQTMWEIGARDKVVGLTTYGQYLEGASQRTNVSGAGRTVNPEAVVGLEPDLVLAPDTIDNETVTKLRGANLTVYQYDEVGSLDGIHRKTRRTGRLVGACAGADETVDWMQSRVDTVRSAVPADERPTLLYVFYGYTAGSETFIHELITTAGADNVAAQAGVERYQPVNAEIVAANDPDWILLNDNSPTVPATAAFNETTAVERNQTITVPIQHLNQPAPRVVLAITAIAERLYPEAYASANRTTSTVTKTTGTATPTTTGRATPPATTGPGFGAVAAVVGLLIALALVGRRQ